MKISKSLLFFLLILFTSLSYAQNKKVLIVSTNIDSVGSNKSGTFLREIAYPFQYFTDNGYQVDIVTPKGGVAAIYQRDKEADELIKIRDSEVFIKQTTNTLSPSQVNVKEYNSVFYPGGHGQYYDVVNDERIAAITAAIYEKGGTIGTAGHGAASLINVRLKNGSFLVDGKSMTCFPHWAEKKFMNISDYGKLLSFDMQEILARRGAKLTVSTEATYGNKEMNEVVDKKNRIVTGAFANSARWVAERMLELMK
jgi:putative intracellular protease/amidase